MNIFTSTSPLKVHKIPYNRGKIHQNATKADQKKVTIYFSSTYSQFRVCKSRWSEVSALSATAASWLMDPERSVGVKGREASRI